MTREEELEKQIAEQGDKIRHMKAVAAAKVGESCLSGKKVQLIGQH